MNKLSKYCYYSAALSVHTASSVHTKVTIRISSHSNSLISNNLFCGKIYNSKRHSSSSTYKRVSPFISLIQLSDSHFFGDSGSKTLNTYVRTFSSFLSPFTTRNDLPSNAAKILLSYPLLWVVLSTNMVQAIFAFGIEVTLPIFVWGLLDKFFIVVKRENFGNGPGLFGSIDSAPKSLNFKEYISGLFTPEYIYNSLKGTDFERLVRKEGAGSSSNFIIDDDLITAVHSRLEPFNCPVYSFEFLSAVSKFYLDLSSKCKIKIINVTKAPRLRESYEAGLHIMRNHSFDKCFIYHSSIDSRFDNDFFFNSFAILASVFEMRYKVVKVNNDGTEFITDYGDGFPGNNDLYIDLTSLQIDDVFKTIFSCSINSKVKFGNELKTVDTSNVLATNFGGQRHYSSHANLSNKKDVDSDVLQGKYYYQYSLLAPYAKVVFGSGNIRLLKLVYE